MAGGGPGLPRRPATDVRSALSPRSDMQVILCLNILFFFSHLFYEYKRCLQKPIIFQHKMHNVVDYVLGAPGPGPKVAGIETNIAR